MSKHASLDERQRKRMRTLENVLRDEGVSVRNTWIVAVARAVTGVQNVTLRIAEIPMFSSFPG